MKLSVLPVLVGLSYLPSGLLAAPAPDHSQQLSTLLSRTAREQLARLKVEENALSKRGIAATCNSTNVAIRREFGSLTQDERKAYTDAVLCLQNKTANTPSSVAPGAKSRYDDFVYTHITQTLFIHFSGTFLGWHRYFTWTYEQALRNECGYEGYQPYWDWPKYASAPQDSPIFNGDAYSMSGNGEYIPGQPGVSLPDPFGNTISLEPGLVGGCVQTGPFANMTVNLGPVGLINATVGPDGGLGYNPRCLKRDVGPYCSETFPNSTRILGLLTERPTIFDFQADLEGTIQPYDLGPHGGGHFTIGGDPGGDLFTSPGDPAFWLHHGQIDRVWTLWQAQDLDNRTYALSGTNTMFNVPPSVNTTLNDTINLGYAGGDIVTFNDIMSTTSGPFCYLYD